MEQGQIFLTENANLLGLHCDILDIFKHFRFRQKIVKPRWFMLFFSERCDLTNYS